MEKSTLFLNHVWAFDRSKVTPEDENRIVLDHIAIAVADINQTGIIFDLLGFSHGNTVYDPLQKANLKMCHSSKYDSIEMVAPVNNNSGPFTILGNNNDSPYHLCFKVSDFKKFLRGLEEKNIEYDMISDAKLAVLFNYKEVMFIFVEGVGLIELLQDPEAATPDKEKYDIIRIVVPEFVEALKFFKYLGYEQEKQVEDAIYGVSSLTLEKHGSGKIELVLPHGDISEEAGFIKQDEPHIYQLCFEYMDKDISKLKNAFDSEGQLYELITARSNYGSLRDVKEMLVPAKAAYSIVYGKKNTN